MKKYFPLLLAVLTLCFFVPGRAIADDPDAASTAAFQRGLQFYATGDYRQALSQFQTAHELGATSSTLFYNIGVCHYRLGSYQEARHAFLQTAENPKMASLAFYNLGLVALKLSDEAGARTWFNRTLDNSPPEKLRLLTLHALAELDKLAPQRRQWRRYAALSIGHDDNVTLAPEGDTLQPSGKADGFNEIMALVHGPIAGGSVSQGLQLQAGGLYRRHFSLDAFDTGSAHLGLFYRKRTASLNLHGGVNYTYAALDDHSFEQLTSAELQATYPLTPTATLRINYQLGYLDILDPLYEALQGWRHRGGLLATLKQGILKARLGYLGEVNDRANEESSPTRHSLRAGFEVKPDATLTLQGAVNFRNSRYGEVSGAERRRDEQLQCSAKIVWSLTQSWDVEGGYEYSRNNSNYNRYDYTRNQVSLALAHQF